ncbi:MAG: TonB-dependent receptor [Flavobacterium sp.]|uniref:TonB-dependent receptor plug domain-containing protein n=1 Tax=Flavobacterium sp. TaxID=239 RepID=UPI0025BBA470|nr:TonB-dependent receptor [Flavobacterium sp.]MCK6608421.1 TonB-dependent receptor [Flavobacterium sp.]
MLKQLLGILFFGFTTITFSQTITIKDKESGDPLESVTLASEDKKVYVVTNNKGQADVSDFVGFNKIIIQSFGYETQMVSYNQLELASFQLSLAPSLLAMDEIIVSANRWKQHTRDIPVKITSISKKDIQLQNPQTAADLLTVSGKVFMQKSQQGGGSPMIRGFATNRLLYAIDGVRMNTAIFRGGNIQNVISLDPFAIEKSEVLFGPSSVIYGSDAIGGVMSFQTLTPQFTTEEKPFVTGSAFTRYSSANNEKTGHFDVNVGWKKWASVTSISSNDFGDLKMGSHGPDEYLRPFYVQRQNGVDVVVTNDDPLVQKPTAYFQINLMQKVRFAPNEKWDFQYGFHFSETSSYSRYDRHIRYNSSGLPRYGEFDYGPQKWIMNNLSISNMQATKMYDELSIRMAHQFFEESRISRNMNNPNRATRIEKVNAISVNADFTKKTSAKNAVFYGVEFVTNDVNSEGIDENIVTGISQTGPARYPQAKWNSYGIYINDQYKFSEKMLLQAGLRYNQFVLNAEFDTTFYPFPFTEAKINDGALTGSLGLVYRPTAKWVISSNVATAFRSPNVDDLGKVFDSEPGSVVVPNPDLKAEYAYNVDLNVAKLFGKNVKVDVSAYYTLLENAMVRRDFTLNGATEILYDGELSNVQAIQNAANAKVYGIQAGIEVKSASGFYFHGDLNFQKGEEELDNGEKSPSRHAAPFFGIGRLGYANSKLDLQLNAQFSDEVSYDNLAEEEKGKPEIYAIDSNGNPYSPSWYTLNLKSMYKLTENFTVTAGLENITDQRYRPYSSGIVAPGKNFILALRAKF